MSNGVTEFILDELIEKLKVLLIERFYWKLLCNPRLFKNMRSQFLTQLSLQIYMLKFLLQKHCTDIIIIIMYCA